jgi:hypothetical protein
MTTNSCQHICIKDCYIVGSEWVGQYGMSFGKMNSKPSSYLLLGKWFVGENLNNLQHKAKINNCLYKVLCMLE